MLRAESIYGVRAANGVVLVTTKKGKGAPALTIAPTRLAKSYQPTKTGQRIQNMLQLVNELIERQQSFTFADPANSFGEGTNW
jgi:hypothetical protein